MYVLFIIPCITYYDCIFKVYGLGYNYLYSSLLSMSLHDAIKYAELNKVLYIERPYYFVLCSMRKYFDTYSNDS